MGLKGTWPPEAASKTRFERIYIKLTFRGKCSVKRWLRSASIAGRTKSTETLSWPQAQNEPRGCPSNVADRVDLKNLPFPSKHMEILGKFPAATNEEPAESQSGVRGR